MGIYALTYLGKRPYVYLRNKLKFPLPAISTPQRWASKFELRKGLLTKLLDIMKAASVKMEDKDKQVVLQFDEVKIKSCYEYDKREDQVLGRLNQLQNATIEKEIFHRPITEHGFFTLYNIIENTDWSFIDNNGELDSEHLFETFLGTIVHNVNVCFPLINTAQTWHKYLKK
jgi:hypothetical protein